MWSFKDLFKRKQEKIEIEKLEIPEFIIRRPPYVHSDHIENCLKESFEDICKPKYGKDSYEK